MSVQAEPIPKAFRPCRHASSIILPAHCGHTVDRDINLIKSPCSRPHYNSRRTPNYRAGQFTTRIFSDRLFSLFVKSLRSSKTICCRFLGSIQPLPPPTSQTDRQRETIEHHAVKNVCAVFQMQTWENLPWQVHRQWFRWRPTTGNSNMATQTGSIYISQSLSDIVEVPNGKFAWGLRRYDHGKLKSDGTWLIAIATVNRGSVSYRYRIEWNRYFKTE